MRLVPFAKMFGGQTAYRLTALFAPDGGIGRITVNGSCDDATHRAIAAAAEEVVAGGVV